MRLAAVLLVAACAACGHRVSSSATAKHPEKPAPCGIRFEKAGGQEPAHESIGTVTLYTVDSDVVTDEMKRDLEREACKMGGDVLTILGPAPHGVRYTVWRKK